MAMHHIGARSSCVRDRVVQLNLDRPMVSDHIPLNYNSGTFIAN